jgi:hypothetical protein
MSIRRDEELEERLEDRRQAADEAAEEQEGEELAELAREGNLEAGREFDGRSEPLYDLAARGELPRTIARGLALSLVVGGVRDVLEDLVAALRAAPTFVDFKLEVRDLRERFEFLERVRRAREARPGS